MSTQVEAVKTPSFSDFAMLELIKKAIQETGYEKPTPIQQAAIPILLQGKDLLGCAQTGTGKTAAFALPILHNLASHPKKAAPKQARALILTPTRELAVQIYDNFKIYGKNLKLSYSVIFGGVGQGAQVQSVARGVDVLVATPGRLIDLIQQRHLSLSQVEVFVLDEADRMLDMGFIHAIRKILQWLPEKRHNLFFSATMPNEIAQLADSMLKNPERVEVTPVSSTAEKIQQTLMYVDKSEKKNLLKYVLKNPDLKRVIIFTRTKHGANKVTETLMKSQISSAAIHGNKSQSARQNALNGFKNGKVRVLVATDIAARGIDVDGITHVINYEIPNISESYVHRIGRTARAGASGQAISFCDAEEKAFIKDIEKLIGKKITVDETHPYHSVQVAQSKPLSKGKAKAKLEAQEPNVFGRQRHRKPRQFGKRPQNGYRGGGGGHRQASGGGSHGAPKR